MRLHRFYTTEELTEDLIYTNQEHLHQWRNVFRYTEGDSIILFGDGFEHTYEIKKIDKKVADLKEVGRRNSLQRNHNLTLAIALIKKDNFELVLEKCTEIGVANFLPIITDRSLQKMYGRERLEKILVEATEQSQWGNVPTMEVPRFFDSLIEEGGKDILILHMAGENISEQKILDNPIICIGPEGGWSERELELMINTNVKKVSLNTGVLRSETAAMISSGILKNTL